MLDWLKPKQTDKRKVKLIPLSDLHTGSTMALFPYYDGRDLGFAPHKNMTGDGGWKFKHGVYKPTGKQYEMFQHFKSCAEKLATMRDEYRFIIVEAGDAVDGIHHDTLQLATRIQWEQNAVHVWLMQFFMHKIGFDKQKGDLLFIGAGTEVHDRDEEDDLAETLGAETIGSDGVFDFLTMDINTRRIWFLHQGASAGKGLNHGNALYNYMKNQYFMCLEDGRKIPDIVISGHYHKDTYSTFTRKDRTMHGLILPPFQLKTRFGYKVAAAELDGVGIRTVDIEADGRITVNPSMLLRPHEDTVEV